MKHIKIWSLLALCLVAMTSCGGGDNNGGDPEPGPKGDLKEKIVASWHLTDWSNGESYADVYIKFDAAGNFDLYQRVDRPGYVHYTGKYSIEEGDVISGVYSDNTAWACKYAGRVNQNGDVLTLVSQGGENITSVYAKSEIPADVTDFVTEIKSTRSDEKRWL